MAKIHKSLIKPKVKKRTLNFKVLDSEAKEIKTTAKKYTRGNVTALVRLAIKQFRPKKSELVPVRASTR
jgi:hypothetical protein